MDEALLRATRDVLATASRTTYLLSLSRALLLEARDSYVAAGLTADASQRSLQCLNELQKVVGKQLASAVRGSQPPYPDEAFLAVLRDKSALGECSGPLERAMHEALKGFATEKSTSVGA
jgi:hypothetical protein